MGKRTARALLDQAEVYAEMDPSGDRRLVVVVRIARRALDALERMKPLLMGITAEAERVAAIDDINALANGDGT